MSRVLFGTDGIRGLANVYPITPEIALRLGKAVAARINSEKAPKIVIGKDTRLSGYMIETALTSGIVSMGVDVYLLGPLPTPAVALLTKSLNADFGIVISASHNPAEDNGIKIFDCDGYKLPDRVEDELEAYILSETADSEVPKRITGDRIGKAYRLDESRGRYIEFAKSTIKDFNLEGIRLVLDCANGAAYYVAPRIFSELGADVVLLNDKPNGLNINQNCGATCPENAAAAVLSEKADIGITLDGDADRVIVCDENGEVIDGDYILAYYAVEMHKENRLGNATLVTTEYSNLAVDQLLNRHGIDTVRTANGDRYVIEEMRRNGFNVGGEASGHIIFSDFVTTGDGIVSALNLLRLLKENGMKPSEIRNIMIKNPQVMLNVKVREKRDFGEIPSVAGKVAEIEESLKDNGRLLLRYSGTENLCRIMIEGGDKDRIERMAGELAETIDAEIGG